MSKPESKLIMTTDLPEAPAYFRKTPRSIVDGFDRSQNCLIPRRLHLWTSTTS